MVMTKIQDTRVLVNGVQIGKLTEDELASDATASAQYITSRITIGLFYQSEMRDSK